MYHTLDYSKSLKTNDSIVELFDGTVGAIKLILTINNECFVLIHTFKKNDLGTIFENYCSHLILLENLNNSVQLFPISCIKQKCILIYTGVINSISFFPNPYERD
jgi:hypothetical protein